MSIGGLHLGARCNPQEVTAADEADPGDIGRIAALIARMHVLTSGVSFPGVRSRTDVGRLRHFATLADAHRDLARTRGVGAFLAAISSVLADWEAALESARGSVPFGPIHHDPSARNILVDQRGDIAALLDFDEAYLGHHVLDIAALLHYWAFDRTPHGPGPLRPVRVRQLLRAYERLRQLTTAERQLLPVAMLVFTAADAAEYLTRWWTRDPDTVNLDTSLSVASFRVLHETTAWRKQLVGSVTGG